MVVVGGGCAGLSCAVELSLLGHQTLLLEKSSYLGGRTSSFKDKTSGEVLDNGQHMMLGCYWETKKFLSRIQQKSSVDFSPTFSASMKGPSEKASQFRTKNWFSPFHLLYAILGYRPITLMDRLKTLRLVLSIKRLKDQQLKKMSCRDLFEQSGQSGLTQERLWDLIVLATLNAQPEEVSAYDFAVVMKLGFMGPKEDHRPGLSKVGLSDLFGTPSKELIEGSGGEVCLNSRVLEVLEVENNLLHVRTKDQIYRTRTVVLTVPPQEILKLQDSIPESFEIIFRRCESIEAIADRFCLSLDEKKTHLQILIRVFGTRRHNGPLIENDL